MIEQLRTGVETAATAFGHGFLTNAANSELHATLRSGGLSPQVFYRQLVRVVHRLLLLLIAEDRGLLHAPATEPAARERYARERSMTRLRQRAAEPPFADLGADLYDGLSRTFDLLGAAGCPALGLPAFGGLFETARTPNLTGCRLSNADLLAAVRALSFDSRGAGAEELGGAYEALLELEPRCAPGAFVLEPAGGRERKSTGSYYTPPALVECLLDAALEPALQEAAVRPNPEAALLALKVCDPACGAGRFLIAAARRIARRLAAVRTGESDPAPAAVQRALRAAVRCCLYGVDLNPMAVELCQVGLWLEAGEPGLPLSFLDHRIQCGNSLLGATPALLAAGVPDEAFAPIDGDDSSACRALRRRHRAERAVARLEPSPDGACDRLLADAWCAAFVQRKVRTANAITEGVLRCLERRPDDVPAATRAEISRLAGQHRFLHWHLAFPDVFGPAGSGGFDVVLGNPPFVNAIEGGIDAATKAFAAFLHPRIAGAADLSCYFLDRSVSLLAPRGRVGMIQPRAILNAASARKLRQALRGGELRPNMLYAPDRCDFFPGAAVFVCALALGPEPTCRASKDDDPQAARWRTGAVADDNWWRAFARILEGAEARDDPVGPALASCCEVAASMTAGDAYDVLPFVVDEPDGTGLRLVTTGLIDPDDCLWGRAACRYLKRDFRCPRVREVPELTRSLRRRLANARRPKVVVAGLSKRVECFLDAAGECVGAVSTYTIFDPADDLRRLRAVCGFLLSDEVSRRFREELGGNAMGGGNITMKRAFLQQLRLPGDLFEGLAAPGAETSSLPPLRGEG